MFDGVGHALVVGVPILLFGFASFWFSRQWPVVILTAVSGALIFGIGVELFAENSATNYRPCDRKGDESSVVIFMVTIVAAQAWGLLAILLGVIHALVPSNFNRFCRLAVQRIRLRIYRRGA